MIQKSPQFQICHYGSKSSTNCSHHGESIWASSIRATVNLHFLVSKHFSWCPNSCFLFILHYYSNEAKSIHQDHICTTNCSFFNVLYIYYWEFDIHFDLWCVKFNHLHFFGNANGCIRYWCIKSQIFSILIRIIEPKNLVNHWNTGSSIVLWYTLKVWMAKKSAG